MKWKYAPRSALKGSKIVTTSTTQRLLRWHFIIIIFYWVRHTIRYDTTTACAWHAELKGCLTWLDLTIRPFFSVCLMYRYNIVVWIKAFNLIDRQTDRQNALDTGVHDSKRRPICSNMLTICLNKLAFVSTIVHQPAMVLKSLMRDQIVHHLENNQLTGETQHGFRKGRSWLTNILSFLDKVTSSIEIWIQYWCGIPGLFQSVW